MSFTPSMRWLDLRSQGVVHFVSLFLCFTPVFSIGGDPQLNIEKRTHGGRSVHVAV